MRVRNASSHDFPTKLTLENGHSQASTSPPMGCGRSAMAVVIDSNMHLLHSEPLVLNGGWSGFSVADTSRMFCLHGV